MDKFVIAFLGTDGSGKSTIINTIKPLLENKFSIPINYEHLRPNYIPSLGVVMRKRTSIQEENNGTATDPHKLPPSGILGSLFRLNYYMIDYIWGYFRKIYPTQNCIWFFDRYYYDYLIDQRRARISLPIWILKLYSFFIPQPDLILCLGGEALKIYKRKPETSMEEVTRQIQALECFCKKHKRTVWIDTTTSLDESIQATMKTIVTMIENTKAK